jgi:nucleoside-diphosphate-sugar epimerase
VILVTGGSGMTGGFVARELLRRGHAVRVLARRPLYLDGVEVVTGDLADRASLARATRDTSGIVHTACTYTDAAVDVAAMEALLAGWTRGPFVFLSSLDVYGLVGAGAITEATPPGDVHNDYSRGKLACERLLAAAGGDHVALRAPYIWGPHPTARRRLVTTRLEAGLPIVLPGTEPAEWSRYCDAWVDVRDLATIVAETIASPTNVGRAAPPEAALSTIASPTNVGRAAPPEAAPSTIASPTNVGRAAPPEAARSTIASPTNVGRAAPPEAARSTITRPAPGPLNVATGSFSWHDLYAALIRLTGSASEIVHKPLAEITDAELPNKQLYAQTWHFPERPWLGAIPRRSFDATLADTVGCSNTLQSQPAPDRISPA